ncbi:MAG: hypothetical protein OEZ47_14175 [Gammaproteobacteria bacterium]|nr:hypothetical protein [Gammaproteobacteria bacterium]
MSFAPPLFLAVSENISNLIRNKPKSGFLESFSPTSGQPEPLDALEKLSIEIRRGRKNAALEIIESTLNSESELTRLSYLENAKAEFEKLAEQISGIEIADPSTATVPKDNRIFFLITLLIFALAVSLAVGVGFE